MDMNKSQKENFSIITIKYKQTTIHIAFSKSVFKYKFQYQITFLLKLPQKRFKYKHKVWTKI